MVIAKTNNSAVVDQVRAAVLGPEGKAPPGYVREGPVPAGDDIAVLDARLDGRYVADGLTDWESGR